jgi:hypothetical protein
MHRWVTFSAMAALLMTACGGGGGDGDSSTAKGQEYVEAIVADGTDEDPPLDEDEVRCAAERWVDLLGIEAFEKAGVTPEDIRASSDENMDFMALVGLTEDQADKAADVMIDCLDLGAVLAASLADEPGLANVPRAKLECVGSAMERTPAFHEAMRLEMLGREASDLDMEQLAADAFDECDVDIGELVGS